MTPESVCLLALMSFYPADKARLTLLPDGKDFCWVVDTDNGRIIVTVENVQRMVTRLFAWFSDAEREVAQSYLMEIDTVRASLRPKKQE